MPVDFGGPPPLLSFMFILIPTIVVVGVGYVVIRSLMRWTRNNASPVETRQAVVVTKRTKVWGGAGEAHANTSYFATFELQDRSRLELPVRERSFGMIVEGDRGLLSYQGTRFLDFQRQV